MGRIAAVAMLAALAGAPAMAEWMRDAEDGSQGDARFYAWTKAVSGSGSLYVRKSETQRNAEIYVSTDTVLCDTTGALPVDVVVDGRRIATVRHMDMSTDRVALFFDHPTDWIERLNRGRRMEFRVVDECGKEVALEFDISGETGFD